MTPAAISRTGCHPRTVCAFVMSGRRRVGSSTGSGRYSTPALEPRWQATRRAKSSTVNSSGLPRLKTPPARVGPFHGGLQACHDVGHIAKTAGLAPIPINRDRLTFQGLYDEVRHDAAVVQTRVRTVDVEDADHTRVQPVRPPVLERCRFTKALALVITGPGTLRIHIAPVGLWLSSPRSRFR